MRDKTQIVFLTDIIAHLTFKSRHDGNHASTKKNKKNEMKCKKLGLNTKGVV